MTEKKSSEGGQDWIEHRRLILAELKRIDALAKEVDGNVDQIHQVHLPELRQEIALLNLRNTLQPALWGAGSGGIVGAVIVFLLRWLMTGSPPEP